jgi:hypothetical protein
VSKPFGKAGVSPLQLLELDYVFSQRPLLTPAKFIEEAGVRGVRLEVGHLEALHRADVLVPLFRVHQGKRQIVRDGDIYAIPWPNTSVEGLRELHAAKRIHIPSEEGFRPWRKDYLRRGASVVWLSSYLYSPWQLLALSDVSTLLPFFRSRRRPAFGQTFNVGGEVFNSTPISQTLVTALSALEPVYYPDLVGRISFAGTLAGDHQQWFDEYVHWIRGRRPDEMLTSLRMSADDLVRWGDGLIARTTFFDPVRSWVPLLRLLAPEKWADATGQTRVALEHRMAAELLLKLRDDLAVEGSAPPLPPPPPFAWTPQHERFNRPAQDLDRVLTDFGISPHPSLVMVLEGQTEMILVGESMDHLHIPRRRSYIELFNIGGNTHDYGLLASYVAMPELGQAIQSDFVRLDRPMTRVMVVTDPENTLATVAGREAKKVSIVNAIFNKLPTKYRTAAARTELDSLVVVETWTGNESFEFAHFTDGEIASAINRIYRKRRQNVTQVKPAQVNAVRLKKGNLKTALLKRLPAPQIQKDQLAEALWPTLRRKLDRQVARGTLDSVPIGRVLGLAVEAAATSFRRSVGLRV